MPKKTIKAKSTQSKTSPKASAKANTSSKATSKNTASKKLISKSITSKSITKVVAKAPSKSIEKTSVVKTAAPLLQPETKTLFKNPPLSKTNSTSATASEAPALKPAFKLEKMDFVETKPANVATVSPIKSPISVVEQSHAEQSQQNSTILKIEKQNQASVVSVPLRIRPRDRMIRPMMKAINGGKGKAPISSAPVKIGPDGRPLPRFPGDGISARALSLAELSNYDFKVGDHAVYPSYGVGTVVAIETKEIMGTKCDFYVVQIRETGMKVMVPKNNVASVGLRPVISKEEAGKVIEILKTTEVRIDNQTWNRRYREYMEKIKTGSVYEIAEVLRDLFLLKVDKELSYGERNMLDTARKLLMRELTLAVDKDELSKQEEVRQIFGL